MRRFSILYSFLALSAGLCAALAATNAWAAGPIKPALAVAAFPAVLLAASKAIGYVVFFVVLLFGSLAVLIPSMRKIVRSKKS